MILETGIKILFTKADMISLIPGPTFVLAIINFLIFVLLMKHFFFKKVEKIIEERQMEVQKGLDEAAVEKRQAYEVKEQYVRKMNHAEDEAEQILQKNIEMGKERASEIIREATEEAQRIKARAKREIERDRLKAKDELKKDLGSLVIETTRKILGQNLSDSDHEVLIQDSLDKMGESPWQN